MIDLIIQRSQFAYKQNILTGFKNATLTSCYILQKTVECKLSLLIWCHHEVASSVNTKVLLDDVIAALSFSHWNIS